MIKSKDLIALKNGDLTVDTLLELYPVKALVNDLVELALQSANAVPDKPITVTKEELDKIMSLFRIQGTSNRGRKPKTQE